MARSNILIAQASANWNAINQWQDTGDSLYYTPGDGDECRLNGFTVSMNITTVPSSGKLISLNAKNAAGTQTAGKLTVALDVLGNSTINADAIVSGTVSSDGIISITGTTSNTLTISGTLTGGSGVNAWGAYLNSSGSLVVNNQVGGGTGTSTHGIRTKSSGSFGTITINGNLTGGSASATGIYCQANGTINITGNVTGGNTSQAHGLYILLGASVTSTINGNVSASSSTSFGIYNNAPTSSSVTINGLIIDSSFFGAISGNFRWNPTSSQYYTVYATGDTPFNAAIPTAENIRKGYVIGDITGTGASQNFGPIKKMIRG